MPDLKHVAVIGGGINGIMIAWAFANGGHEVDLYEKTTLISETSRASSKMLHGGIRYLEQGHFGLVKQALQERTWWIRQAPHLTKQFELLIPVYQREGRSKWKLRLGTGLYDLLAHGSGFPKGRWYGPREALSVLPSLKQEGLVGAYSYWDGQMDDYALGLWAAGEAKRTGIKIHENARVSHLDPEHGSLKVFGRQRQFDLIINATGPWAKQLLDQSGVQSNYALDLVQGTHILVTGPIHKGCVLQVAHEKRIVFVVPYQGKTLIGTTESKIDTPENCMVSENEVDYLINNYNQFFKNKLSRSDVIDAFCGTRPIISSGKNFSRASREYALERNGKILTVFGGKWTVSRPLAKSVLSLVL